MYIVIYTFYAYDEGHCSSWSQGDEKYVQVFLGKCFRKW